MKASERASASHRLRGGAEGHGLGVTLGIAVVAACLSVSVSSLAQPAEPGRLQSAEVVAVVVDVVVVHGLVSVQVRDAPLNVVLDEIARQTGLRIEGHASIADRITIELDQVGLAEALRLILDDQRYVLEYAFEALPDAAEHVRVPQRVRIFPDDADAPARSGSVNDDDTAEAGLDGDTIDVWQMRAVLESADDPWDREDAVEALAESEQPDVAVPLLRMALADRDEYVRLSAVEALATLGGDGAAAALEMALRDTESVIRKEAIETLEAIGGGSGHAELDRCAARRRRRPPEASRRRAGQHGQPRHAPAPGVRLGHRRRRIGPCRGGGVAETAQSAAPLRARARIATHVRPAPHLHPFSARGFEPLAYSCSSVLIEMPVFTACLLETLTDEEYWS